METKDIDPNPNAMAEERAMTIADATDPRVITVVIASSVELKTLLESPLLMVSSATNAMVKTILARYAILRPGHRVMTKVISINLDQGVDLRVKTSMKLYKVILTMKVNMMTMMIQNCRNTAMLKHCITMML